MERRPFSVALLGAFGLIFAFIAVATGRDPTPGLVMTIGFALIYTLVLVVILRGPIVLAFLTEIVACSKATPGVFSGLYRKYEWPIKWSLLALFYVATAAGIWWLVVTFPTQA